MQTRVEGPLNYASIRSIQDAIAERTSDSDNVMLMSVTANMISADLDHAHYSHFADSHIYFSTGAPESWKLIALEEMKGADWLLLDTDDRHELMTIHNRTSYESVMADERFANVLYSEFVLDTTIDTYNLYRRISVPTE